jgi:hypothetical protein
VSSLLSRGHGPGEGLIWLLIQGGSAGIAWVMHAAPRLGWLLAAGEALHCGASSGGYGAAAQLHRSAVAAVVKVRQTMHSSRGPSLVTNDGVLFERVLQGTRVWAAKCLVRIFVLVIATVSSRENVLHMNCNGLCGAFRCSMLQANVHRVTLKIVYVAISREGMCVIVNVCPAAYPGQR